MPSLGLTPVTPSVVINSSGTEVSSSAFSLSATTACQFKDTQASRHWEVINISASDLYIKGGGVASATDYEGIATAGSATPLQLAFIGDRIGVYNTGAGAAVHGTNFLVRCRR